MRGRFLLVGMPFIFGSMAFADSEGLTREQIQEVIRKERAPVIKCYEDGLKRNPRLKGRFTLSFEIGADGGVVKAKILKSTLRHRVTEECIVEASQKWIFPKPVGAKPVHVDYPFALSKLRKDRG